MNPNPPKLPPELYAELMSHLREVDGQYEAADMQAFLQFIAANDSAHPQLLALLKR